MGFGSRFSCLLLLASSAFAQTSLHLKAFHADRAADVHALRAPGPRRSLLRSHLLVQFSGTPSNDQLERLRARGIRVLSYVPDFGFAVSAPDRTSFDGLDLQWAGRLEADEKISPRAQAGAAADGNGHWIVEFYPDTDPNDARSIALQNGLVTREHPALLPYHVLVEGSYSRIAALMAWDEVAYIFPASEALVRGEAVYRCAGAMAAEAMVPQYAPTVGDGWDGPGLGGAALNYAFVNTTAKLPADSAKSEIARAYNEWAKGVNVTFTLTTNPYATRTIGVLFGSGAHGDAYPFDGRGGVLAHTFYPYPSNPEPIAGDMHFDDDESWHVGADIDLFSVALHETGHALGLGHSDNPNDVMYPYYRRATGLTQDDINAALTLYAPAQSVTPTNAAPPSQPTPPATPDTTPVVVFTAPCASGSYTATTPSINVAGAAASTAGIASVSWSNSQGGGGNASGGANWSVASIPLKPGINVITVTALAVSGKQSSATLQVTYGQAGTDKTPPTLTIRSPLVTSIYTSAAALTISGSARDNVGVASISWSNSTGASGAANGTTQWTAANIPLGLGVNTIIIRAADTAGNVAWRSVIATRH